MLGQFWGGFGAVKGMCVLLPWNVLDRAYNPDIVSDATAAYTESSGGRTLIKAQTTLSSIWSRLQLPQELYHHINMFTREDIG